MRQEFEVVVRGGDERATTALALEHLKVAGPDINPLTDEQSSDVLSVLVTADSEAGARERVQKALPPDGDYVVEQVNRRESD